MIANFAAQPPEHFVNGNALCVYVGPFLVPVEIPMSDGVWWPKRTRELINNLPPCLRDGQRSVSLLQRLQRRLVSWPQRPPKGLDNWDKRHRKE